MALAFFGQVLLSGCIGGSGLENFRRMLESDVGRRADDPNAHRNRYPSTFTSRHVLDNGNVEEEFYMGGDCRFYFEMDTNQWIVGWRYHPVQNNCRANP